MKQTKLIIAALMSVLALTFTAGCSTDNQPETPDTSRSVVTAAPDTASDALWSNAIYTEDTELGEGKVTIQVSVQAGDRQVTFTINTDSGNLADALTDNSLVEGDQSEYGLYIKTVNGIKADYDADGAWWGLYKDGEMTPAGADGTMIADGDQYQLVYSK